jgi:transcriptional regulator with XRE-family HTH domain
VDIAKRVLKIRERVRQLASFSDDSLVDSQVGRRMKKLRKELGLSQADLVHKGCTTAHISRIEAGLRRPSLERVFKLAVLLGVTPWYLARGIDIPADTGAQAWLTFTLSTHDTRQRRRFLKRRARRLKGEIRRLRAIQA